MFDERGPTRSRIRRAHRPCPRLRGLRCDVHSTISS